jgi:acyl-CoA dehydrogenase
VSVPESSYPMPEADREIQAAARAFVDELIPHEVEAELHDGELLERHRRRVHELGFDAINMPKELGGGFSAFQQVLVQEQVGRATNALGWVIHTPASWLPQVATDEQLERWVVPTIRGERRECYAITEEGAGSDVDAIEATALRDGDGYLLNGVKWHVTSFNHPPPTATPTPTTTRWSPSCASPPGSSSARRATACASPTSGSATSG